MYPFLANICQCRASTASIAGTRTVLELVLVVHALGRTASNYDPMQRIKPPCLVQMKGRNIGNAAGGQTPHIPCRTLGFECSSHEQDMGGVGFSWEVVEDTGGGVFHRLM